MIDPSLHSIEEWSADLVTYLARYGVDNATTEAEWKQWASNIQSLPYIGSRGLPSPDSFDDWRDWARQFNYLIERPQ
jgi:hypothetical protein